MKIDSCSLSLAELQARFITILPRLERHGKISFRRVRCPTRKEECIAEMIALAWLWFVRLFRQGKDPLAFPSAIATFAARKVRSGGRLCGQEKAKDVLSPLGQTRYGFTVSELPQRSSLYGNPLDDALRDSTQSTPDQLAAFRCDFPAWLDRLGERNRALALDMALGNRTDELAGGYGITCGRVSQIRRELHDNWQRFHGEPDSCPVPPTV